LDVAFDFFLLFLTVVGAGEESSGSASVVACVGLEVLLFLDDAGALDGMGDDSFSATSSLLFRLFFDETSLSLSLSLEEETAVR
jgi:hypothetical protein